MSHIGLHRRSAGSLKNRRMWEGGPIGFRKSGKQRTRAHLAHPGSPWLTLAHPGSPWLTRAGWA